MSNAAVVQDETEDRYFTQVEEGDVRLFTLDQLDAAFNAGLIHENTYVCLEGDSKWLTLAEVAGLSDEEEPVSAPQLVAAPVAHFAAPAAPRAPAPQARYEAASAYPPVISAASVAPAPYSVAPMVMPRSIAPVTNDLAFDDDMDMMAMRPKRRAGKIVGALAALTLIGVAVAVVQSGGIRLPKLNLGEGVGQASAASLSLSSLKQAEATNTQAPAPTPVAEAAKAEPPKAEEAKPAEPAEGTAAKKGDDRFSEEMKEALLNKDKKQAPSKKQKAGHGAIASTHKAGSKPAKGSAGFKTGGSAYDPLNGKL